MRRISNPLLLAAGLLPLVVVGCSGSSTYDVSGNVTYAGKPLNGGVIAFEPADGPTPDPRPSTGATIVDGHYATPHGKGVGGGSYTVRISPPAVGSGMPGAQVVSFSLFVTKVDLPKEASVKDFAIPAAGPPGR